MAFVLSASRLRLTTAKYFGKPPVVGAGTVTAVTAGAGLTSAPNPIVGTGTISLAVPVTVARGGTGAITLTGILRGNGVGAITGGAVVDLTADVTGVLPMANGGTGANALAAGVVVSGGAFLTTVSPLLVTNGGTAATSFGTGPCYIKGDVATPLVGQDIPIPVTDGGTGAITLTGLLRGTGATAITGAATVSLTTEVTGTLPIANGGSGQTTANAALNAFLPAQAGKAGSYLKTDGTNTSWQSVAGSGTVTSIDISGGTTGLTASGGPVTTSGTITLAGTLNIANGGTGSSTQAGAFDNLSPMTTIGDMIYGATAGDGTRLAGNTTTTNQFLRSVGDGVNAAAPTWSVLAPADIPVNSITQPGAVTTAPDDATKFWRGDASWAVPVAAAAAGGADTQIQYNNATAIDGMSKFTATTNGTPAITSAAAPGAPTDGELWNDSSSKSFRGYVNGASQWVQASLFTQTATQQTTSNTDSTILGTGNGVTTFPANFFVVGRVVRCSAWGWCSNGDAAPNAKTFKVGLGGTNLVTMTTATAQYNTGDYLKFEAVIHCRTTGAPGTFFAELHMTRTSTAANDSHRLQTSTSATNVTTTGALTLDWTWHSNNAAGKISTWAATIEVIA